METNEQKTLQTPQEDNYTTGGKWQVRRTMFQNSTHMAVISKFISSM